MWRRRPDASANVSRHQRHRRGRRPIGVTTRRNMRPVRADWHLALFDTVVSWNHNNSRESTEGDRAGCAARRPPAMSQYAATAAATLTVLRAVSISTLIAADQFCF